VAPAWSRMLCLPSSFVCAACATISHGARGGVQHLKVVVDSTIFLSGNRTGYSTGRLAAQSFGCERISQLLNHLACQEKVWGTVRTSEM